MEAALPNARQGTFDGVHVYNGLRAMIVGLLQAEMHLPRSRSLKEKRSTLKSLRDQLRGRFNVAVAELDSNEKWQRATFGVSTVANERAYIEGLLRQVTEWLRMSHVVELIRVDEECVTLKSLWAEDAR